MANSAPLGVINLSKQFLAAARHTQEPATNAAQEIGQKLSLVAYYLAGHSIELSFKAFLLGRGMTVETLRNRKYGHNLSVLLAESRRRKLGNCVKLARQDLAVVQTLDGCYAAKEFEYMFYGSRTLPRYSLVIALATRLHGGIAPYCNGLAANNSFKPKPLRGSA